MKGENAKAQMRKGVLEYCIMLIIANKPSYTSEIIDALKNSKLIVVEGTLYPLLSRLKNTGFLSYTWQESSQGPPRKYYEITTQGGKLLSELETGWTELSEAVEKLKKQQFKQS